MYRLTEPGSDSNAQNMKNKDIAGFMSRVIKSCDSDLKKKIVYSDLATQSESKWYKKRR